MIERLRTWRGGVRLREAWAAIGLGRRHVWSGSRRAYVEYRPVEPERAAFERALEAELQALPGVAWARLNAPLRRVVVAFEGEPVDPERLRAVVDALEARFGLVGRPSWRDRRPFPGEEEPMLRFAAEAGADALGFTAGLGLRLLRVKTVPAEIDFAALLALFEYVPSLRERIEGRVGPHVAELGLVFAEALSSALVQGMTGPVVGGVRRVLELRETMAQVDAWAQAEPELGAREQTHPPTHVEERREAPLPPGPIERYAGQVLPAAAGAVGFGFVASRRLSSATIPVFSGVPKPAVMGREAFAADLGRMLARRGLVVMDREALRRLDRLDCLVLAAELLRPRAARVEAIVAVGRLHPADARRNAMRLLDLGEPTARREDGKWSLQPLDPRSRESGGAGGGGSEPWSDAVEQMAARLREPGGLLLALRHRDDRDGDEIAALVSLVPMGDPAVEGLVAAARRAGLQVVVAGERPRERGWVEPDRVVPGGADTVASLRTLQAEGHAVCFVHRGPSTAFGAADLGLGLYDREEDGGCPPWGASILCRGGLADVGLVLEAVGAARAASSQSVYLAVIEAVSGLVLSVGGLRGRTVRRVMMAANAASLLAMANAVRLARGVRPVLAAASRDSTAWHALEVEEALERLGSGPRGLSAEAARDRRRAPAERPTAASRFADMLVGELANPLAPVLVAGAGLSAMVGSVVDAGLVGGVVALNAVLGAVQRYRTDQALAALSEANGHAVRVRRDGAPLEVDPSEVVPGDVLVLEAGDSVSADARLVEARGLELDESSLTGESLPVAKDPAPSFAAAVADRTSMVFEGTTVAAGTAVAVVTAVGDETESRRAVARIGEARPTGVEARLEALTELLAPMAALSGGALMTAGLSLDRPAAEVISSGVSLAVAAVPEGLPLLATMAQLAAARRLSERGALVRNPRAIEALGRANVLCADKTGTLTEGTIVLRLVSDGEREAAVEELPEDLQGVLRAALRAGPTAEVEDLPHPTDRALVEGAHAAGLHRRDDAEGWKLRASLPFEPGRGYHAVLGRKQGEERLHVSVKGAPERVVPLCTRRARGGEVRSLAEGDGQALMEAAVALAGRGLRVLAVAERSIAPRERLADRHVEDLTFLGFVAFADPVRDTAKAAVDALRRAGVDVVMITGDHPSTAAAIAAELGLAAGQQAVLAGPELDRLDDEALDARVEQVSVFARVTPSQKVRIVRALQQRGRTVAMTGDGANDAPAIRLADVGIALGGQATSSARRAADVVVTDGRIETIVEAVLEGRALWRSVRDAVALLVGGNLGEIGFTVLGGLLEGRSPLNARQLLLVNLLTDAVPALAVALRRPAHTSPEEMMQEGPEASLGAALDRDIAWRAGVTGTATTAAWLSARVLGGRRGADTVALLTLVGSQLGQTLVLGGRDRTVVAAGLGSLAVLLALVETPGVSGFFGSRPLGPIGLAQATLASAGATAVTALAPRLRRRPRVQRLGARVGQVMKRLRPTREHAAAA